MKPVRIQRSRQRKQVSPNGLPIVYVGRGTKYGNPFKLGEKAGDEWKGIFDKNDSYIYLSKGKVLKRKDALYLFEKYKSLEMSEFREVNGGKNVSCWCKVEEECHADLLMKLWNE